MDPRPLWTAIHQVCILDLAELLELTMFKHLVDERENLDRTVRK